MFDYRQGVKQEGIEISRTLEEDGWTILDGKPEQSFRFDHGSPDNGPIVGIWSCTPGTIEQASQHFNEFVNVYEGEIVATLNDDESVVLKPGDSFFVPQGAKIRWEIRQTVAKYLMVCGGGPLV